jgi:hypothetical protein
VSIWAKAIVVTQVPLPGLWWVEGANLALGTEGAVPSPLADEMTRAAGAMITANELPGHIGAVRAVYTVCRMPRCRLAEGAEDGLPPLDQMPPLSADGLILADHVVNTRARVPGSAFRLSPFRGTNRNAPRQTGRTVTGLTVARVSEQTDLQTRFTAHPWTAQEGCAHAS